MPPGSKMVQVFAVLRCYKCETFQVQQVKKTNKWSCKVCGKKQSVTKVYGKGSAPDCRKHVQKLNMIRGEVEQERNQDVMEKHPPEDYASAFDATEPQLQEEEEEEEFSHPVFVGGRQSKWITYADPQESDEESDSTDGGALYTTDRREFVQTNKKLRRSASEYLVTSRSNLPKTTREIVYPYSSVSREMELLLDNQTPQMKAATSCFTLCTKESLSRYTKLEEEPFLYDHKDHFVTPLSSHQDIVSSSQDLSEKLPLQSQLQKIRRDIRRYSMESSEGDAEIPKVASKWSRFMRETEEDKEEEEEEEEEDGSDTSGHALHNNLSVSRYTLKKEDSTD